MDKNTAAKENSKPSAKRKSPRKITQSYLHNAGLYYLQRYAASSARFHSVMERKIDRSCRAHPEQNKELCLQMLQDLIRKFQNLELLDDAAYTRGAVLSLRRSGLPAKAVINKLRAKGIAPADSAAALQKLDLENYSSPEDAERAAALHYVRKKRLGPFAGAKDVPFDKALARMARAGFSFDTARSVLEMSAQEADTERTVF